MKKILIIFLIFLFAFPVVAKNQPRIPFDGSIVFAPLASRTTYMIDTAGQVIKTWESDYIPGLSVYYLSDGSILRTILVSGGALQGGGVQRISSDGELLWEFIYNTGSVCSHHDVAPLPNGNILMLAYEAKQYGETVEAGRNPDYIWDVLLVEHIIEVKPTSPSSGEIVWEWHVWNHLIQDYDASKENYGVVSEHPELVDVNYGNEIGYDWLHANSLDYNERLDQIMISVRNFNEVWVIDHSTTSLEAMGHAGGRSGKGGDILYRWGNPEAYDTGDASDKVFYWQHDARWVKDGYPGSGSITVFNNGVGRGYTSVDELIPPIDSTGDYLLSPGEPFAPSSLSWSFTSDGISSYHLGGCERLPNGNTLILSGEKGDFFVVTPGGHVIWSYDYFVPPPLGVIFSPCFVPDDVSLVPDLDTEGVLHWSDVKPGAVVSSSFIVRNIGAGSVNWSVDESLLTWGDWSFTPSSGSCAGDSMTVMVSVVVPDESNSDFEGYVKVMNTDNPTDYELVPVVLSTSYAVSLGVHGFIFESLNKRAW